MCMCVRVCVCVEGEEEGWTGEGWSWGGLLVELVGRREEEYVIASLVT